LLFIGFIIVTMFGIPREVRALVNAQADIDKDGIVQILDLRILITNFGRSRLQGFIPSNLDPDIVQNGAVNIFDYSMLAANFGSIISTPSPTASPTSGQVKMLCLGRSYSDWGNTAPIKIGGNPDDTDPNIQKVVRNCSFVNPTGTAVYKAAIIIKQGTNILIEGNRFENIRTLIPDDGILAIAMPAQGPISNVTIRNNLFTDIGADGIQPGTSGPDITNIKIENNEFIGSEDVGENGVDVKGVYGPIYITGNKMHGFRPCESSKTKVPGTQDCTGSTGPAITIHQGGTGYYPTDIYIIGNELYDNTKGIDMSGGKNIVVQNNKIHDNLKYGIEYTGGEIELSGNVYFNNPVNCFGISPCQ
jgi:parallel beta-helix repeat protein